jgi:hypothetical protein
LAAGTAWTLLYVVFVASLGSELRAVAEERDSAGPVHGVSPLLYVSSVAAGVWAMWLYAIIRPRSHSTLKSGMVVGLAWWVLSSLESSKWAVLLDIPARAWIPLIANIEITVGAAVVGALLFGAVGTAEPRPLAGGIETDG